MKIYYCLMIASKIGNDSESMITERKKKLPLTFTFKKKIRILYFYSFFTLFEIFLFCPKIQLRLPRIIFLGEKLMKMLGFWTF